MVGEYVVLFLIAALHLAILKHHKYKAASHRGLSLDDCRMAAMLATTVLVPWHLGYVVVFLIFLVLWADAFLFRIFAMELDPHLLREYLLESLKDHAERRFMARSLRWNFFGLHPFFAASTLAGVAYWSHLFEAVAIALALVLFVLLLAAQVTAALWRDAPSFFRETSYLRYLAGKRLDLDDPQFALRPVHEGLLETPPFRRAHSTQHGRLAGANVVLVTLESVARDHLALHAEGGAATPFLEDLAAHSVVSSNHFCISAQTIAAHHAIYTGHYRPTTDFGLLEAVRRAGMRMIYLTTAGTTAWGLDTLLQEACFETILEREDFVPHPMDGGRVSDYALFDQGVSRLAEVAEGGERFFAHVHLANSHFDYRVVDPQRFNRWPGDGYRDRFMNCIEETDWILSEFFCRLEEAGLGDDTLAIVTSDHGEAFGEFGYTLHCNAVIKEEVNVPFLLHHPQLEAERLDFSTHFDILPTVLDLLGIDHMGSHHGESVFNPGRPKRAFLYSESLRGGVPSSTALIDGERKFLIDLFFSRYWDTDWDDGDIKEMTPEDRRYFSALFYRTLAQRGLIRGKS